MCEALMELMKDELDEARNDGIQLGKQQGLSSSSLDFLSDLGEVPQNLQDKIRNENNIDILKLYLKMAASVDSIEDFCNYIK